jgi:UDP-N-acetylmuramate--alanine ligase
LRHDHPDCRAAHRPSLVFLRHRRIGHVAPRADPQGAGAQVSGSDRGRDQGRSPEKFAWLESLGFTLFPQDGSGLTDPCQTLVASAAVEDTVPEVVRARELGCARLSRAQLLAQLFNAADCGVAVGGTSGKSTVTGMIGWILTALERDPTIMNGAVMKNFASADAPFASARVGSGEIFVSEVDESDGSIALYAPRVAVLNNVSLDHKSLEELRVLFGDFLAAAPVAVLNADDAESLALRPRARAAITFGFAPEAMISALPESIVEGPTSLAATVIDRRDGSTAPSPSRCRAATTSPMRWPPLPLPVRWGFRWGRPPPRWARSRALPAGSTSWARAPLA